MLDASEQAKRRRECWQAVLRGMANITSGVTQIITAIASYYTGETLTTR